MSAALISVVVLCKNEEQRIARCVSSLDFADRVVIVDSYSSDATRAECFRAWQSTGRSLADIVFVQALWRGFTKARNNSLDWVSTQWVLWVDADEWVSPNLRAEIRALLSQNPKEPQVYKIPRQSFFLGRAIKFGGWYPDRKARLARAANCLWKPGPNSADVHEDLWPQPENERPSLKSDLYHEPFIDESEQLETNRRYSDLLAQGAAQKYRDSGSRPPSEVFILLKVAVKFVENYFWKLGVLDGRAGWIIAKGSAHSLYLRLRRIRELLSSSA